MGHFFGWGVILQIAAIVHWSRKRPATYWLFIIIFFGFLGALAYFLVEGIDYGSVNRSLHGPSRRRRIRELQAIVRENPSAGNYEELGDLLLTEKRYAEARAAFDAALAQRTDSIDPFYRRGVAEFELGDYNAAISDLERVVKQEPKYDYSRGRCLLAQSLARAGRTADAEAAFDALVSSTTSAEATVAAAEFYAERGRTKEARELAETMIGREATMPTYQKRRDRPFLRRAKKLLRAVVVTALLPFIACSPHRPETHAFKVGLLTPGSINDGGWNNIAWQGLQQIKRQLGAQVSNQEVKSPAEIAEGFRAYGRNGYDLAFGHGFEFQDPALAAGKQFPKTVFITTSGSSVAPNVSPMVFELEQATYLLGIIAARESKTGKAGLVGGINLPSIASTFLAFKAGAQSVDPKFEVKEIYTGNFDDLGAAKQATLTLIDAGCDFIFHQANEAGRGVFQACEERHVRCFGSNKNQNDMAPDVIVASAVLDVPSAFVYMAKLVRDHQFKPHIYWLGMNEGIVSLVWNDKLKSTMKPETVAEVARVEQRIRSGTFEVPRGKF